MPPLRKELIQFYLMKPHILFSLALGYKEYNLLLRFSCVIAWVCSCYFKTGLNVHFKAICNITEKLFN